MFQAVMLLPKASKQQKTPIISLCSTLSPKARSQYKSSALLVVSLNILQISLSVESTSFPSISMRFWFVLLGPGQGLQTKKQSEYNSRNELCYIELIITQKLHFEITQKVYISSVSSLASQCSSDLPTRVQPFQPSVHQSISQDS